MYLLRYLLFFILITTFYSAHSQQDVDFHLNATFLNGKNVLKVKRDFHDPYLWALVKNNEVYRINSITGAVDNFTAKFSSFSNLQFIDIAGYSGDNVFIATNSTNVLEYKNGPIKVIGVADGITGLVNSIGIDNAGQGNGFSRSDNIVMIATAKGICRYDYKEGVILPVPAIADSRIYEATYRNEMMSDGDYGRNYQDTVEMFPVFFLINQTLYGGELWMGAHAFGHTLKSAFFTRGSAFDNVMVSLYTNQFWATEKGLFQNNWNYSYRTDTYGYHHYLSGLDISKITSIYGLLNFMGPNDSGYPKENLLVGTNKGLYFSNSHYQGTIPEYQFFHYTPLGDKPINDICVNATSYNAYNICEEGVWVAATDGLYLLKPDYSIFSNAAQQLNAVQFEGQDNTVNEVQLCANTSIKATMNTFIYNGGLIQWYKDGHELPNESKAEITITEGGDYYAVLYDPCSTSHFETNHLKVTQASAPVFSFNYPDQLNYCSGTTATLSTNNNPVYQYRWYKDGLLNNNVTSTLSTTESGKYKVEVSACNGSWVASKEVKINFISVPKPVVTADKPAYCAGEQAMLTANVPIDATGIINWSPYQYRWYKDGVLYNNNTQSQLHTSESGKYKVEIIGCSGIWVASEETVINFINLQKPVIIRDKPAYCIGDNAKLSINFVNDGTYTIRWLKDGISMDAYINNTSVTTNLPGKYEVSLSNNLTNCSQQSSAYQLTFEQPPLLSIQQVILTTLCSGQTIDLQASYTNGAIKWSTGQTSDKISVNQAGEYTAEVTTIGGCTVTQSTNVQYLNAPIIAVADVTLCQFTNEAVTLSAPIGFTKYEWNGHAGDNTFTTNKLGQVSLTVTDNNGCKASQIITIGNHCQDIHIPNTFTPNGDGINDTWAISGLDNDQSVRVNIYNRNGTLLFANKGYAVPWDGTYKGKALPSGVYYYVINTSREKQMINGYVTIVR